MKTIFRKLKVGKATHAHIVCINTFVKRHDAMLSLFHPYIRRREICIRLLIIFTRIDQSNIFVGLTILSLKILFLTIFTLIKYTRLVGFTRFITYFTF